MNYFIIVLLGLALGSFLNVVIYRLPKKIPFFQGRSFCPHCKHILKPIDLIPIFSFFLQRGRCRYCGKLISWQYPVVELATALVLALLYLQFGFSLPFFVYAVFSAILMVIFVIDLRYYLILDKLTLPSIVLAFLASLLLLKEPLLSILLAGIMGGGFFLIQLVISKGKWIGGGDIRLGVLTGFMLGLERFILALVVAYIAGAMVGLVLVLFKKKTLKSKMPFGTFLASSTILFLIVGDVITQWFFSWYY